jgi:hypothetical protein
MGYLPKLGTTVVSHILPKQVFINHSTLPFAAVQNDSRTVPPGLPPGLQQNISVLVSIFHSYLSDPNKQHKRTPITKQLVETRASVATTLPNVSNKKTDASDNNHSLVRHYLGIATFTTTDTEQNIFRSVTRLQQKVTISSPTMLFLILVKTGFRQI